ncbi:MAG: glycosyltransferase family 39 protein [Clostridia bacterium]|nr:glycosyltransferase family 39 protein [Clostridia bacterium]
MEKLKEFVKRNQNKILLVLLVVIILLQVLLRIEYGFEKAYLHIDEGYSYGLMNYDKIDIMDNEDFYNTWHKSEYYKDYLSISSKEAMDLTPVYENQKNDVHPPFYYLLLRIASSFTIGSFSKWTGIVLNIVIFILTSIFIYLIANRIFKSKIYAVFMVLVNGFTLASIDTTIFIRMYALNALNLLIIAYLHIKNTNKGKLSCKELAIMSIAIIIGSLTHYYYLVFLFILFIMYLIKFIKQKNTKNILRYVSMIIISAIISLAIFPYSFVHMFMGYRGTGTISSLTNINQMWNSFRTYCNILCDNVFNGILLFMVLVSVAVVVYHFIKNKKLSIKFENKEFWLMFIPSVIYFTMVALVSPYQELRYIMPVCPLLVIGGFYLLKVLLEKVFSKKNTYYILSAIFVVMLILPSIIKLDIPFYYLYKDKKEIVTKIEQEQDKPVLYIFNKEQNRFLDDLYLFTISDQSYIMDKEEFSKEKLKEIFTNINFKNGFFVIINEGLEHETYLKEISETLNVTGYEHIQRMNACDIYQME